MKKLRCLIFIKKNLIQISSVLPIIFVINQTLFAQSTLPTVFAQGTITSPAKNAKSKSTTSVQNINDSGATGQLVTTITQSAGGSSGNITVTTTNTINGDLTATGGTVVRVGDVNLSGSDVGTATVRTTTNMKGGDFKDGGTHEFGVVDLTNSELGKVDINTESNLQGNVKTKNKSSVSVGGVNVGNEAKQQQFEQNRGNMAAVSRPNNLAGKAIPSQNQLNNQQLSQLEKDRLFAYMSACSYNNNFCSKHIILALKKAGWITSNWLAIDHGPDSSVEYMIFTNEQTNEVSVVFRGSQSVVTCGTDVCEDAISNFKPYKKADLEAVESIANMVKNMYPNSKITFTGHSKGGGEAMWAARTIKDSEAVIFNPRFAHKTLEVFEQGRARGYVVEGEILKSAQIGAAKIIRDVGIAPGLPDEIIGAIAAYHMERWYEYIDTVSPTSNSATDRHRIPDVLAGLDEKIQQSG